MVTVKIEGTAYSLYNVYTVVTANHGITAWLWYMYIRAVIPQLCIYMRIHVHAYTYVQCTCILHTHTHT